MVESQNWTSEFKSSFRNLKDLYTFLGWDASPELQKVADTYSVFVPRRIAAKMKSEGAEGIFARQFLPAELEVDADLNLKGFEDPIGDKEYFKAPQLIHRYPSRVLFAPTTVCPVHCRYCFRKNELNAQDEIFQNDFAETLRYLREHSEISEVIFTGGDPFTLSNEKLAAYLQAFSELSSIKDIRFHTRYPVILPERFDPELISILGKFAVRFRTLTIAIHANHAQEFDTEADLAVKKLSATGAQLLSQTVLLKGINDSESALSDLIQKFLDLKIRPYYLHHPDRVKGGMHFYLPLEKGRMVYQQLRKSVPGWALPHYVIDVPGGHGKVQAYNPETTKFSGHLLSRDGQTVTVQEPDFFI